MEKTELENINQKYLSKKDKSKEISDFDSVEDQKDLHYLDNIAAEGTKKGFEKAKKVANEIIIAQNGKLIRKRPGKPNEILSKLEERQVEAGKTISL